MQILRILGLFATFFNLQVMGLRIATSLQWIEYTPQPWAIKNFYKADTATLVSGGVANLADRSVDLAANAETQGLKQFANRKNFRLIYIIVEVAYRMVANKAAGINKIEDLKGKRIGSIPGTSAEVFVRNMMTNAGLTDRDYTLVSGNVCMKNPCGSGTFPAQLKAKTIDAFGVWEPAVELGIQAIGEANAIVFKNASAYREIYSLYSTQEKLSDAPTRAKIVEFVKALNQTLDIFRNDPDKVYSTVSGNVGVDVPVLKNVWEDHNWGGIGGPSGDLGDGLLDFLYREEQYHATHDRRTAASRADLAKFIDKSILEEVLKS